MTQALGAFVPKPAQTGDAFQARCAVGRPLIVQVVGVDGARVVKDQVSGQSSAKKAITVHVWDLVGGQVSFDQNNMPVMGGPNTVYCNVMWFAGAVVDNLEQYVGAAPMPVKLRFTKGDGPKPYLVVDPLEGPELQQVSAFFAQDPTRINREAAAKAQASATQSAAPAYQQSGFTPMQVQPTAPAQQPLNGYTVPGPGQVQGGQYPPQVPVPAQFQSPAPAQQYGQPGGFVQAAAPEVAQMPVMDAYQQHQASNGMTPGAMVNAGQITPAQAVQAYQQPPAQAQFQQPGVPAQVAQPMQAPGQPGYVHNSDVANILQGLAANGQQPQQ